MPLPFMLGEKKKVVGMIFKDKPMIESESQEKDDMKEMHKKEMRRLAMREASMDMMEAFEKHDRLLFQSALRAFVVCCLDEYEDKEDENEGE